MKLFKGLFLSFSFFWLIGLSTASRAQSVISFKIDGDHFSGTIQEAVLINIGGENYLQIKSAKKDQLVFLYLKEKALNGELPVTLAYKEHDHEKKQTPDAEIVWAPEGGEQPPWNTVEGEAIVTQYDANARIISGTFEFVVEKQDFSTKKDKKKEQAEIEDGKFDKIQFVVDATAAKK